MLPLYCTSALPICCPYAACMLPACCPYTLSTRASLPQPTRSDLRSGDTRDIDTRHDTRGEGGGTDRSSRR
eukprot:1290430-Rhodomonas_salina.1